MSVLFKEALYYTTRLKTQLTCGKNNDETRDLFASGIWIASPRGGKNLFFATNRHLTDYKYSQDELHRMGYNSISSIDVELRKFNGSTPLGETKIFNLFSPPNKVYYPKDDSDLAIISISTNQTIFRNATRDGFKPL